MSNVKTGLPGPHEQPGSYGFDGFGVFQTRIYEDVDGAKIDALALQMQAKGYAYRVTESVSGNKRIEIDIPPGGGGSTTVITELPFDLWEYSGGAAQKDLLSASVNTGKTATIVQSQVELIRKCLANDFSDTADGKTAIESDFIDGVGHPGNAFTLYQLMKSGYTDYLVHQPIIKKTQTTSYLYPISLTKLNVGKIHSTSTLISLEDPPTWAVTGLPTDAPPNFLNIALDYGWVKIPPTISTVANRKVQVVQEYQYGLWATDTYGTPI